MDNSKFYKLNTESVSWVQECLDTGEAFSKLVAATMDLELGTMYLVVANKQHAEAVKNALPLNQGVMNDTIVRTSQQVELMYELLKNKVKHSSPLSIMVEDNLVYSTDKNAINELDKSYLYDDRFLHIRTLDELPTPADFSRLLAQSSGYPLDAFVVEQKNLPSDKKLSEKDASELLAVTVGIINSAFDGETYTLWLRNGYTLAG